MMWLHTRPETTGSRGLQQSYVADICMMYIQYDFTSSPRSSQKHQPQAVRLAEPIVRGGWTYMIIDVP